MGNRLKPELGRRCFRFAFLAVPCLPLTSSNTPCLPMANDSWSTSRSTTVRPRPSLLSTTGNPSHDLYLGRSRVSPGRCDCVLGISSTLRQQPRSSAPPQFDCLPEGLCRIRPYLWS